MTAFLFDTLRLSRTLRDKGHFSAEQAEALAEALGEATQGDLATKADLTEIRTEIAKIKTELKSEIAGVRTEIGDVRTEMAGLKAELKTEIADLRTELKTEIADLKTELTSEIAGLRSDQRTEIAAVRTEIAGTKIELLKWVAGAIGLQTVVILGAVISMLKILAK